jgi:hypothetical protein
MDDPTYFGYGGFSFSWGDHICAIFEDPSQQGQIMGGFMAQGLRAAQRCVWVAPTSSAQRFRESLVEIGADLPTLEASGQLLVISDVDFYLQDGLFEPDRVMDLLRTLLADGRRFGYPTMRIATDVSWLRGNRLDPDLWEEFEGRQTQELAGLPAVLVCQYDRRQLSGSIIVAALRTHRIIILGDAIHQNPFYVAPAAGPAVREIM